MKMSHMRLSRLLILLVVLLGFAFTASAQEATILGTVMDQSGSVVPSVSIILTNAETGQNYTTVSNSAGQYVVPGVRIGSYSIKADLQGFKTWTTSGVVVRVGDRVRVDISLQVGQMSDHITVESEALRVQADSSEVSDVITGTQVTSLATNGRNLLALAALAPGASSQLIGNAFNTPTPVGSNFFTSFNGLNPDHNVWITDGGENYDRGGGGKSAIMPSIESLAEFRTLTSNYSAEYGLGSGGTMTMVLKSGTRDLHGTLWEFLRNDKLDANDFFNNVNGTRKPSMRYNVYGFNLGGPVVFPGYNRDRDKTFFFYNMEWRTLRQPQQFNVQVASDAMLAGAIPASHNAVVPSNLSSSQIARLAACGLTPGQPLTQIPAACIDPNAAAFIAAGLMPRANDSTGTRYQAPYSVPIDLREELARVDHRFSDRFSVFGHFVAEQVAQGFATPTWSGSSYPTVGSTFNNPSYSAVVRATYSISPTLISETSYNYSGNRINILPTGNDQKPAGWTAPEYFSTNNTNKQPQINWQKQLGTNFNTWSQPWTNVADSYQIREDLSTIRGRHELKFGGTYLFYKKKQQLFGNTQGAFSFNGNFTGSDWADFLLGYASNYAELALQDSHVWHNNNYGFYFQDNWRVSDRLTLNLGLRWEGMPHVYEVDHAQANFYPERFDVNEIPRYLADGSMDPTGPGFRTVNGVPLSSTPFYMNGIGIEGEDGVPVGLVKNTWNNWAPRVGLAYDVTGRGKTVIRMGYGRMYERVQGNDVYNGAGNPPFSYAPSVNNVLLSNPATSTQTGLTAAVPFKPSALTGLAYSDYKAPTSNQWSAGIQQELWAKTVLSIAYVGNLNVHQNVYRESNTPAFSDTATRAAVVSRQITDINTVRPYNGYSTIRLGHNATNGHYNGLQVNFRAQTDRGLTLQVAYTLSRAINSIPVGQGIGGGDLANVSNPFDWNYDYGLSPLDRTQMLNINYVYDLPFFKNSSRAVKAMLGGWQISGVTQFQSGTALSVGYDASRLGLGGNVANRADQTGSVSYPKTITLWFDPSAFTAPADLEFGNSKKGTIRGPGANNWNLSLYKSFKGIPWFAGKEGADLQFRLETFNTFNHPQWNNPNVNRSSGDFSKITTTTGPRSLQLGLKFLF
jgi:hypothetical protein